MIDHIPPDWPNREISRMISSGTIDWHIQSCGTGPDILFLHGAGASTHSWGETLRLLEDRFTCHAVDLPGHGFTTGAQSFQLSLSGMVRELTSLIEKIGISPELLVGHSAGAAVAVSYAEHNSHLPIVAINGAFEAFEGWAGVMFPMIAQSMVAVPLVRDFFTIPLAQSSDIERLINSTGSLLNAEGIGRYRYLLKRREHITGTLGMMARWNLSVDMPRGPMIQSHITFVQAQDDGTVPFNSTKTFRQSVPNADEIVFERGGHLIHELFPDRISTIVAGVIDAEKPRSEARL
ncbi:MAG: alpha/beta fold hydrolase BchO [Pseudomonadota bacterium]